MAARMTDRGYSIWRFPSTELYSMELGTQTTRDSLGNTNGTITVQRETRDSKNGGQPQGKFLEVWLVNSSGTLLRGIL